MTLRRLLALVVAWTVLVLICSVGVWSVIRTAGTDVTTPPEIPTTVMDNSRGTSLGTTSPGSATPTSRPHRRSTPQPSPTEGPSVPADDPATGRGGGQTGTGGEHDGNEEADPSAADAESGQSEIRRTWQGAAGAVVASCRGATISFRGAQPNSGWRVEVGSRGPEQIEVHFSTNEGADDEGEVELKAQCARGAPRFSTAGD